jgi:hypothetical protein
MNPIDVIAITLLEIAIAAIAIVCAVKFLSTKNSDNLIDRQTGRTALFLSVAMAGLLATIICKQAGLVGRDTGAIMGIASSLMMLLAGSIAAAWPEKRQTVAHSA